MHSAYIKAISYHLPLNILSNEDLNQSFPEWSIEKIANKTGIYTRTIAGEDETSVDLGVLAAKKCFQEYDISPNDIDFVLFCTQSPDYFLPTSACIIQEQLQIPTTAGALDFNLGCSGFIYGLSLAKGLIETNQANNVLLITAETYSKFIHKEDKSVRTLFGDAGAATIISAHERLSSNLNSFVFGTDGKGANNLMVKRGGKRFPILSESIIKDEYGNIHDENSLYMNGSEIFIFTLRIAPKTLSAVLNKSGLSIDDIDLFIFHQANKYMLDELRKKLQIPENKFYTFFENCGNTVSSTIPIAMNHAIKNGKIKSGMRVMIMGFGVGYSWAGAIVEF
jgi:3-oxoacyl-[acyl-carrier-protein] synthase III